LPIKLLHLDTITPGRVRSVSTVKSMIQLIATTPLYTSYTEEPFRQQMEI